MGEASQIEEPKRRGSDIPKIDYRKDFPDLPSQVYSLLEKKDEQIESWKRMALQDPMMEILRKEHFLPDLEEEVTKLKKGEISAIVVGELDLDNFGWWNDLFESHLLGDQALINLGAVLRERLRDEDLLSRLGGEEIGIRLDINNSMTTDEIVSLCAGISQEIGERIKGELLDNITDTLLNDHRFVRTNRRDASYNRISEREGTVVLKEFAEKLLEIRGNNKLDAKIAQVKGTPEQKKALKERIESIDLTAYAEYLSDERVWDELTDEPEDEEKASALARRKEIETGMVEDIKHIFVENTCSIGFQVVTSDDKDKINSAGDILKRADSLMYKAKGEGRNRAFMKVGMAPGDPQEFVFGETPSL